MFFSAAYISSKRPTNEHFFFCSDKTKMRSLKDRYENFLEEEKRRLTRNDKLLQTMEDIDYRASTLAAKTERLKLLKVSIIRTLLLLLLSTTTHPARWITTIHLRSKFLEKRHRHNHVHMIHRHGFHRRRPASISVVDPLSPSSFSTLFPPLPRIEFRSASLWRGARTDDANCTS